MDQCVIGRPKCNVHAWRMSAGAPQHSAHSVPQLSQCRTDVSLLSLMIDVLKTSPVAVQM